VLERLSYLSAIFAVDICADAVLSHQYHMVPYVDQRRAKAWNVEQVIA
jgi:hypothetical protein